MGVETEYAIYGTVRNGQAVDREYVARRLIDIARERYPVLSDGSDHGVFLPNGGRLYVDAGNHPELATPECSDPWETLRYIRAGEMLLEEIVREELASGQYAELVLLRANVDYTGDTWGSHESYLLRSYDVPVLAENLVSHLVSRMVFCGAGGFDPGRVERPFTLSPRAAFLNSPVSIASVNDRPILHLKDEPECEGRFHRLHLICGETLCSDTGTVLRLGTTALIAALVDLARQPGLAVRLHDPVEALRTFAADPFFVASARARDGAPLTALGIQRHYLREVSGAVARGELPDWASRLCALWRLTLDRLARDPASLDRTLDWVIKRRLYQQWTRSANRGRATPVELLEADLRFGQIGRPGVFAEMDRRGVLDHAQASNEEIRRAMLTGPAEGRGKLRSEWIHRLARENRLFDDGERFSCGWSGIWDGHRERHVSLGDPFASVAGWSGAGNPGF